MVIQSHTKIRIGQINIEQYTDITIHQEIASHHSIEIVVDLNRLKEDTESFNSKDYLGKKLKLNINTSVFEDSEEEFVFDGIITKVKNIKGNSDMHLNQVVIIAKSPTILLDDGPHFSSYSDMSITELIDKIHAPYEEALPVFDVEPMDDSYVSYSVQNGESAFAYISRLASQYGEWFYYDGKKLIFGKPQSKEIKLSRDHDLKYFEISLNPISNNYKYYSNDYTSDEVQKPIRVESKDMGSGANGYIGYSNDKSKSIFNQEKNIWHNMCSELKVQEKLEKRVNKQKEALEINQMKLIGTSINPQVKLGSIILIEGDKYRVTKVTHHDSENGIYENNFEAITAEFDIYPYTNINANPISQSQTAIVKENTDPKKLGRIRVQFPWQKDKDDLSPWIRIVSAHAGADKGFQFIPEIGEEVLIGFEGGNAERPYMLGSLYNGAANTESWHTKNNDIKAIRTRSGHTIEFNDENGAETIKIYDHEGSVISFDTQAKSLSISSAENIDIMAKNINIAAEEDVNIHAKGNVNTSSGEDITLISESKTSIQSKEDLEIKANANMIIDVTDKLDVSGKNIAIIADSNTIIKSNKTTIQGKITTVEGAANKLKIG